MTDERRAFVDSIRDFARREVGTREQRDALTDHGHEPHNQEVYERVAELGWIGVSIPEQYGGSGGGAVDMCLMLEETSRGLIPIQFVGVSMITAGAVGRFGSAWMMKHIPARRMLVVYSLVNVLLCVVGVTEPNWAGVVCVLLTSFFMSIMFPPIFALGL